MSNRFARAATQNDENLVFVRSPELVADLIAARARGVEGVGVFDHTGALSLDDTAETIILYDAHAAIVDALSWSSAAEGVVIDR